MASNLRVWACSHSDHRRSLRFLVSGFREKRARGEMIGVNKIGDIRRRARAGEPVASIARHVGVSEPTVRKHARMADLSPEPPSVRRLESEVLAPLRED